MTGSAEIRENEIREESLGELLSEKYLSYALSTIMSRSLPDVRDGLKPVHRRLLFAMYQLKLNPQNMPKKCARVVGDVIGKFHPHGDQAVYDTLVRLAQDFALRYPLIDGQGNFGNIDGDNAAAMRYTESRLTTTALRMLEGIDENAVDFRATYDGETMEPVVLPANFPNLLANGASGIAVGMATSIPPHNVAEICRALMLVLDGDPDVDELLRVMPGPDFPTGGVLVETPDKIREAYATGRGGFRLRARWEREDLKQGLYQIVVTEIPYMVQKARLVEKIAELINARKIPLLDDVRDESTEDVRLVLVPKSRNVEPELLMEALFRQTDLESRIPLNMNVLEDGRVPRVMTLREVLRAYLDHRQVVLVRRSRHRLEQVLHRLEVLEGYLVVYLNLDEVIRIIRETDEPRPELMAAFDLTEVQADAILNMRLRSLRKLEEMELRREHDGLSAERDGLRALLGSEDRQWQRIREEVETLAKDYAPDTAPGARRTLLSDVPVHAVNVEALADAMIEKEPVTVALSEKGWIRALKGHGHNIAELKYKEGDSGAMALEVQTTDKMLIFASDGRCYTLGCDGLPSGRGFGEPLRLMIDLSNEASPVVMLPYVAGQRLLVASSPGRGFIVKSDDLLSKVRAGKQVMTLEGKETLRICLPLREREDHLAVIGTNRRMLVFPLAEIPEMARGKGVILQKYKEGGISDMRAFVLEEGLSYKYGAGETRVEDIRPWLGKRAQTGRLPPNGFPRNNRFG